MEWFGQGRHKITFDLAIRFPASDDHFVRIDDGKFRVHVLADLFDNPGADDNAMEAVVTLYRKSLARDMSVDDMLDASNSNLPLIQPMELLQHHLYRIGTWNHAHDTSHKPATTKKKAATGKSKLILPSGQPNVSKDVDFCFPIVAESWSNDPERLHLFCVPSYDFEEFCVGECEAEIDWHVEFDHRHHYLPPYDMVPRNKENFTRLKQRIERFAALPMDQRPIVGSDVPLLPPYSFNIFKPANFGMTTPTTRVDINIAVRCVSHVKLKALTFPWDIRFTVSSQASAERIRQQIERELNMAADAHEDDRTSSMLFAPRLQNTWGCELWVLPQEPAELKMFRYAVAGDEIGSKLACFLHNDLVKAGDCRLYMEAHIVPKKDDWLVTGTSYRVDEDVDEEDNDELQADREEDGDGENEAQPVGRRLLDARRTNPGFAKRMGLRSSRDLSTTSQAGRGRQSQIAGNAKPTDDPADGSDHEPPEHAHGGAAMDHDDEDEPGQNGAMSHNGAGEQDQDGFVDIDDLDLINRDGQHAIEQSMEDDKRTKQAPTLPQSRTEAEERAAEDMLNNVNETRSGMPRAENDDDELMGEDEMAEDLVDSEGEVEAEAETYEDGDEAHDEEEDVPSPGVDSPADNAAHRSSGSQHRTFTVVDGGGRGSSVLHLTSFRLKRQAPPEPSDSDEEE